MGIPPSPLVVLPPPPCLPYPSHLSSRLQYALTLALEFVQIASVLLSRGTIDLLHVDAMALRDSSFPCVMPMRPLNSLAFRGSMPIFLFLILGYVQPHAVCGRVYFTCATEGCTAGP